MCRAEAAMDGDRPQRSIFRVSGICAVCSIPLSRPRKIDRNDRFSEGGKEVCCILRKSQTPGGDRERCAETELPDKQKCHHPAEPFRVVDFFQVAVRTARTRHRSAKFCPDQTIAD